MRRLGDGCSFGELDHGVEDAGAGPPLRIGHAELGAEEPGQSPLAGADVVSQPGHGPGLAEVVDDDFAGVSQSGVAGCWQGERLDVGVAEPVVQDGPDPPGFGSREVGFGAGDDELAEQASDGQDGRRGVRQRGSVRPEPDDVEGGLPVDTVFVPDPGRDSDGTIAGSDPGSLLGPDGQNPGADVDQLVVVVPVTVDDIASGVGVDLGGGHRMVAVLRH